MANLDAVAQQLRSWRGGAGSPSFATIARRVGERRANHGEDVSLAAPGRITVYDCFRDGRTRVDLDLVVDIAAALGITGAELTSWRELCVSVIAPAAASGIATSWLDTVRSDLFWVSTPIDVSVDDRLIVAGMAGSGKTRAAENVLARRVRDGKIDRALTLKLAGRRVAADAIYEAIAREIGLSLPRSLSDRAAHVAAALTSARVGLLLDDIVDAEQAASLIDREGSVVVVATSRRALAVDGLTRIDIPPWTHEQSRTYLAEVIGQTRADDDPASVDLISAATDGHPLLTSLVAARIRSAEGWSLADHAAVLGERRGSNRDASVLDAAMRATYGALSTTAQDALNVLVAAPIGGLTERALVALLGDAVCDSIAELRQHFLIGESGKRTVVHDVVREAVRSRLVDEEPPAVRDARESAIVQRFCAEAWSVAQALSPTDFEASRFGRAPSRVDDAHEWISVALPGLFDLVVAAGSRQRRALIELAEAMANSLVRAGLVRMAKQVQLAAHEASIAIGDRAGAARARVMLAAIEPSTHDPIGELDELAVVAERSGDAATIARVWNRRAVMAMRDGNDVEALRAYGVAQETARNAGLLTLAAAYAGNLSLAHTYLGDFIGALRWNRAALDHAELLGNDASIASALSNLSETQRFLGELSEAVASGERSVALAEGVGDQVSLAHASLNLGAALARLGEAERALALIERAERTMSEIGIDTMAATLHTHAGIALESRGDDAGAAIRYRAAIAAPRDNPVDQASAIHRLGRMSVTSDPAASISLFDQALELLGERFEQLAREVRNDRDAVSRGVAQPLR